jgi:hypothetical protein
MKNARVLAAALAACLLGTLLCGCGQKSRTPEEVIQAAMEKVSQADGMKYEMDLDLSFHVTSGEFDQEMDITAEADLLCTKDPMVIQMALDMDMGDLMELETLIYGQEQEDGTILLQTSTDGGKTFVTSTVDGAEKEQYDASANMKQYLAGIAEAKETGKDTVDGKTAIRYDGVITGESIQKVLEASGVLRQFSQAGLDASDVSTLYQNMGAISVSLWIDPETNEILRYSIDMTEVLQDMLNGMMSQLMDGETVSVVVKKAVGEVHDIKWNPTESIVLPTSTANGGAGTGSIAGSWTLTHVEASGMKMSIEKLKELGGEALEELEDELNLSFNIREDGTFSAVVSGLSADGTWTAGNGSTYILTIEGEDQEVTLEGDTLTLEQEDVCLIFTRA